MSGVTNLDDSLHHVHHLVDDGDDLVRPLGWRHVGPVSGRQDVAARHVEHVGGGELEVNRGAVGVVDDGGEEGVFSWWNAQNHTVRATQASYRRFSSSLQWVNSFGITTDA